MRGLLAVTPLTDLWMFRVQVEGKKRSQPYDLREGQRYLLELLPAFFAVQHLVLHLKFFLD